MTTMPDPKWKAYDNARTRKRLSITLSPEAHELLTRQAEERGNLSWSYYLEHLLFEEQARKTTPESGGKAGT